MSSAAGSARYVEPVLQRARHYTAACGKSTVMAEERKLRVAVVGAAGTWGRFYLKAYNDHPDVDVIAIADQAARRDDFAARFGIQHVYATVEELLAVHGAPDIVSAVVPVSQNFPVISACVEAGVRVVSCEKPIHWDLKQADAIVELCRGTHTLLACAQCHLSQPFGTEVFDWVAEGNIGEVTSACIPGGCPREISGGACPQLAAIRLLCGMEVSWVEGWVLPPEPTYEVVPEGRPAV